MAQSCSDGMQTGPAFCAGAGACSGAAGHRLRRVRLRLVNLLHELHDRRGVRFGPAVHRVDVCAGPEGRGAQADAAAPDASTQTDAAPQADAAAQTDALLQTDAVAQGDATVQKDAVAQTDALGQTDAVSQVDATVQSDAVLQADALPQMDATLQADAASQEDALLQQDAVGPDVHGGLPGRGCGCRAAFEARAPVLPLTVLLGALAVVRRRSSAARSGATCRSRGA